MIRSIQSYARLQWRNFVRDHYYEWTDWFRQQHLASGLGKVDITQLSTLRSARLSEMFPSAQIGVESLAQEYAEDSTITEIAKQVTIVEGVGWLGSIFREDAITLYLLVRMLTPDTAVETGVQLGVSTAHILRAMHLNGKGRLLSIDAPQDYTPFRCGYLVPPELRTDMHVVTGYSQECLRPLLEQVGTIDFFLHDSDHRQSVMTWELETVWPFLKSGGVLSAHDVLMHNAFSRFCWRHRTEISHAFTVYNLGVCQRS